MNKKDIKIALEKQIPKKVKAIEDDFGYFICGNCEHYIYYEDCYDAHKYCLNCGQKLDWD